MKLKLLFAFFIAVSFFFGMISSGVYFGYPITHYHPPASMSVPNK